MKVRAANTPTQRHMPTGTPPSGVPYAVLVVGMHRSGTSAVTSALGALGLALPRVGDLLGARHGNDRGHYESLSLMVVSDEILQRLGGGWDDPPHLPADPAGSEELAPIARRATATFEASFGTPERAVCWKDPRTAVLLPFWRQVIERPVAAVLCIRHPLDVARSLQRRDRLAIPIALALWERYYRRAVAGLAGLPVFVTTFDDAVRDPAAWRLQMQAWIKSLGIEVGANGAGEMPFDPSLQHYRTEPAGARETHLGGDRGDRGGRSGTARSDAGAAGAGGQAGGGGDRESGVLESQAVLYRDLLGLVGAHDSFGYVPTIVESPWTDHVLEQRRDSLRMWRALDWLSQELAGHLLAAPVATSPQVDPYPLNATEDLDGYRAWLTARGEPTQLPRMSVSDLVAAAGPEGSSGQSQTGPASSVRRVLGTVAAVPSSAAKRAFHPPTLATTPTTAGEPALAAPQATASLFSVVVPCYRSPLWAIDRAVASVLAQDYADWELCLCDDGSDDLALSERLSELTTVDPRIRVATRLRNGGISAATNSALELATGGYVVFLDHDDELAPTALSQIAAAIAERPDTDLVYSDEDKIDNDGNRHMPSFKPDWSPDLLLSNAYMCHVLVVRRSLVTELGGLRSEFDGAQDYDLMLRATERTTAIVHIPEVLYHWRTMAGSASGDASAKPWAFEAGRLAVADAVARRHIDATVVHHPKVPGSYHVIRRPKTDALVSAIIPFRDEPALTAACYRSFIEQAGYDNFELLLVDNDSALPETRALLEDLARDHRVRLLEAPGPFDWVAINNEAARKARGDLLLFLNNDVEARSAGWLSAMVAQAERPQVGAVGARLLYPDGTIQHAGVVVGVGWGATHVQHSLPAEHPGYLSLTTVTRNFSAVTGACMMTRRSVFEEVGGFDGNLPIAFNDIDYCLRLRELGLLIVYTPLAELVHYESKSRGHSDDVKEAPFFRRRWRTLMLSGDPYYNKNLGRFDNNCRLPSQEEEAQWQIFRSMLNESSTS
jgi:GT2 family glycosyltransferase